jgi:hypothetical protein
MELEAFLDQCAAISMAQFEDPSDLYDVLSQGESVWEDVAGERAERREKQGYIDPRDARAFLRQATLHNTDIRDTPDYLTTSYFRKWDPPSTGIRPPTTDDIAPDSTGNRLLPSDDPTATTGGATHTDTPDYYAMVSAAMTQLAQDNPPAYQDRTKELAYLVNVIKAGAANDGERYQLYQAAEAAISTVALGIALQHPDGGDTMTDLLIQTSAVNLFKQAVYYLYTNQTAVRYDHLVPNRQKLGLWVQHL